MNTIINNKITMFNLNNAADKSTNTYQEPGISENVIITEVKLGESSLKKTPYIELLTKNDKGDLGKSSKMYLSTTVGDGKKTSGWAITARNIVDLIVATHNCTEEEAKNMIAVESQAQLVNKVSALLVGKPFRGKFKGEESDKGIIYATLDSVESMQVAKENSKLRFNPEKDIKRIPKAVDNVINTTEASAADLPF